YSSGATAKPGESYVSLNGREWVDLTALYPDSNACIKVFTIPSVPGSEISASDLYSSSRYSLPLKPIVWVVPPPLPTPTPTPVPLNTTTPTPEPSLTPDSTMDEDSSDTVPPNPVPYVPDNGTPTPTETPTETPAEPTPTVTPTPHEKPTPAPTVTPHEEPSPVPTVTPHEEPTPSPTEPKETPQPKPHKNPPGHKRGKGLEDLLIYLSGIHFTV
ncbi:MAG TPA: lectin like domain-containing protein, partial [Methanomicrobiales archaeon]|nr:lectin like domain-containing protein [Methanomicrobiales archaeon]